MLITENPSQAHYIANGYWGKITTVAATTRTTGALPTNSVHTTYPITFQHTKSVHIEVTLSAKIKYIPVNSTD